ncbi:MAG: mechanosensitive ion channel family protein [Phycisphaerales bacterium]|nr:MAG: mechanosensitive ion channel family protein [Phycisphaerales bacterium]
MDLKALIENVSTWLVEHGLRILLVLILMFVFIKIAQAATHRFFRGFGKGRRETDEEFKKKADTLSSIAASVLTIVIVIIAAITIMGELDIPISPILASAGIVGVALGFGGQHLVKDIISGFFILLDDQIRVGDVVQIAGKGGLVEKINLRMTILRDLAGNVHYVRNGEISVVTNMTKEYSRYVFDVGIAYREDVDKVIEVIKEVDENLRNDPEFKNDILEPIEILGLDQFADSAIIIKARTKTKPIRQWAVGREFNKRLKKRFDAEGIEIPFPHRTLYTGSATDPFPVRIVDKQ